MYNTEKKCIGLIFHFIFQCYKRKYHFPDLAIPAWMVQRLEASDQTSWGDFPWRPSSTIASCMKYSVQSNCLTKPTVELQTPSEMWRLAHKRWPNQPKGEKGGLNEYCLPIWMPEPFESWVPTKEDIFSHSPLCWDENPPVWKEMKKKAVI